MMRRRVLVMVSLLAVLSLGFTGKSQYALAYDGEERQVGTRGLQPQGLLQRVAEAARVEGSGRLAARGSGYAAVHGDGRIGIVGHGLGTVRIRGAEVIRAEGHGRRYDLVDGTTFLVGWRGRVHIEGHGLDVDILGANIEFAARGTGWVFLKGRGRYWASGEPGLWTLEGTRVSLPAANESAQ
jgi:hypothetical protein